MTAKHTYKINAKADREIPLKIMKKCNYMHVTVP